MLGEPASKSNSRKIVRRGGKPVPIKSDKARDYEDNFHMFCRQLPHEDQFTEDVVLGVRVWYRTRRPDLEVELIKDLLQGYAYKNDRQVKVQVMFHGIDRSSPRALIIVAPVAEAPDVFQVLHNRDYGSPFRF